MAHEMLKGVWPISHSVHPSLGTLAGESAPTPVWVSSETTFKSAMPGRTHVDKAQLTLLPQLLVVQGLLGQLVLPFDRLLGVQLVRPR